MKEKILDFAFEILCKKVKLENKVSMMRKLLAIILSLLTWNTRYVLSFTKESSLSILKSSQYRQSMEFQRSSNDGDNFFRSVAWMSGSGRCYGSNDSPQEFVDRRTATTGVVSAFMGICSASLLRPITSSEAAVGTLPEFSDKNAVIQGVTVNVADNTQFYNMVDFLREGFGFKVLRQSVTGSVSSVWLGFGPEQMSVPSDFVIPVSSFGTYGGHASIEVRFDAKATETFYDGVKVEGTNIAYLQVGVPGYRISQMMKYGGNVKDAFGLVNVISPAGIPFRSIVGISPDPIMFIAIYTSNIAESCAFYESLGITKQQYPYARLGSGTGQFEPPQPKGSVYLSTSPNSMGILLLPTEKKKTKLTPNPAFNALRVVYNPSDQSDTQNAQNLQVTDPSSMNISFVPYSRFEAEERIGSEAAQKEQAQKL